MNLAIGNAQHIGARAQQQDAFGFSDPGDAGFARHAGFAAVLADGMGGMTHGDAASRTAVKTFLAEYAAKRAEESIPAALHRSLLEANRAVCRTARELGAGEDMGTTLVGAVVHGESLYWAASGDSAIFLYRDGEFTQLNTPHVYAVELDAKAAAGAITRESALGDPERESLTSYLGMTELAAVDRNLRGVALEAGDCVLLASDGLFKTLDEGGMRAAMLGTFQERCDQLVRGVLEQQREGQDNVTVIALGLEEGVAARAFRPAVPQAVARRRSPRKAAVAVLLVGIAAGLSAAAYHWYQAGRGLAAARHSTGEEKPAGGAVYDASKIPPGGKIERSAPAAAPASGKENQQ